MINEEIARLTGTLKFNVDARALVTFEKRLASVEGKLRAFSELANRKFNIKVTLDAKTLRAQLDKAMNAKVVFKNFSADMTALNNLQKSICEKLDRTPIKLNNVKINISEVMAQRAMLRQHLGSVSIAAKVSLNFKEANASMRTWKKNTEQRFKLHLNADISMAKLYRNASRSLKTISAKLGTIHLKTPKIQLSVDRAHLRAEIASVLAQIKREVRIKIDLNSGPVSGRMRSRAAGHSGKGLGRFAAFEALGGLGMAAIPGLGALMGFQHLNETNQKIQGMGTGLLSVTGNKRDADATQKRYDAMGKEVGFDTLKLAPVFLKMLAAGEGTGFKQSQSEKIFKNMAEYGRVMGLTGQNMHLALMAVERMMSKGQIMSRELKGELAIQFPGAEALLAKSMGKTIPELLAAMKKGLVKSDVLNAFAEELHKKAMMGGALQSAEQQTAAQQARLHNAETLSVKNFANGGFDRATNSLFKEAADSLEKMQPLVTSLGTAFELLSKPLGAVMDIFGKLGESLPNIAAAFGLTSSQLTMMGIAAGILIAPFGTLAVIFSVLALAIEDLIGFSEGKDSLFGRWLKDTPAAQASFNELSNSVKELSKNLDGVFKQLGDLGPALKGLSFSDMLVSTMHEISLLLDLFNGAVDRLVSAGLFSKEASGNADGIGGFILRNFRNIQGVIQGPDENAKWLDKDREFKRQQALDGLKTQPEELDHRGPKAQSVASADQTTGEGSPAQRALYAEAKRNPLTIENIHVTIKGDGILTAGNMEAGLKTAFEDIAQQTVGKMLRETGVNQTEVQ